MALDYIHKVTGQSWLLIRSCIVSSNKGNMRGCGRNNKQGNKKINVMVQTLFIFSDFSQTFAFFRVISSLNLLETIWNTMSK